MRFFAGFLPLTLLSVLSPIAAAPDGNLSFQDGENFTFKYSTSSAQPKNWIGIYHTTGGPDDEKFHVPSLVWAYAPSIDGSVVISAPFRASGQYKAYFLADDGYKLLAQPITFTPESKNNGRPNELKIITYNLWQGGTRVNDYHQKQVRFLKESGADIIGLQEASGEHAKRLGNALGWNYHQANPQDTSAIISRYPITKRHDKVMERSTGVAIDVDSKPEKAINFWSIHATAYPYGPYEVSFEGKTGDAIMEAEKKSGRVQEITDVLQGTSSQQQENKPFVLVGDFNAPSHLDWTGATKDKHCGATFRWPTSSLPKDTGLVDSFRVAHPDPATVPGNTWSPIELHNSDENKEEPQDRIDFIYHKGALQVMSSEVKVAGDPKPAPGYENNEWTSDHAAVLTTYNLG